jgi:hypothetical protein
MGPKRDRLVRAVSHFNRREWSFGELAGELEELNRTGVWSELENREREAFHVFFRDWYDPFDPALRPRPGTFGRLRDIVDEVFKGEVRISEDSLRSRAEALERILTEPPSGDE